MFYVVFSTIQRADIRQLLQTSSAWGKNNQIILVYQMVNFFVANHTPTLIGNCLTPLLTSKGADTLGPHLTCIDKTAKINALQLL